MELGVVHHLPDGDTAMSLTCHRILHDLEEDR